MQRLRGQGIAIGPYGLPQRVGIIPQRATDAMRPPAPASHLHAALSKQASDQNPVLDRRDMAVGLIPV